MPDIQQWFENVTHSLQRIEKLLASNHSSNENHAAGYSAPGEGPGLGNRLLNAREAAKTLGISERKLWDLAHRGKIPCVRIDRAIRYSLRDLEAWIEEQTSSMKKEGRNGQHQS
jgi:excisionase family DNA binding protein